MTGRVLSSRMVSGANASETDHEPAVLLTIMHPDLTQPIRVTDTPVELLDPATYGEDVFGVISRGEVFICLGFEFILPAENDQMTQTVSLQIDNVGRDLVDPILNLQSAPEMKLEVILTSHPDEVEFTIDDLKLKAVKGTAIVLSADVTTEDITREPYPKDRFTPARFPGVFKGIA